MEMSRAINNEEGGMIIKRVSVPIGLEDLMEGLAKEVLLRKPEDVCSFAADYFAYLLDLRERGKYKGKAKSAQMACNRASNFNFSNFEIDENIPPLVIPKKIVQRKKYSKNQLVRSKSKTSSTSRSSVSRSTVSQSSKSSVEKSSKSEESSLTLTEKSKPSRKTDSCPVASNSKYEQLTKKYSASLEEKVNLKKRSSRKGPSERKPLKATTQIEADFKKDEKKALSKENSLEKVKEVNKSQFLKMLVYPNVNGVRIEPKIKKSKRDQSVEAKTETLNKSANKAASGKKDTKKVKGENKKEIKDPTNQSKDNSITTKEESTSSNEPQSSPTNTNMQENLEESPRKMSDNEDTSINDVSLPEDTISIEKDIISEKNDYGVDKTDLAKTTEQCNEENLKPLIENKISPTNSVKESLQEQQSLVETDTQKEETNKIKETETEKSEEAKGTENVNETLSKIDTVILSEKEPEEIIKNVQSEATQNDINITTLDKDPEVQMESLKDTTKNTINTDALDQPDDKTAIISEIENTKAENVNITNIKENNTTERSINAKEGSIENLKDIKVDEEKIRIPSQIPQKIPDKKNIRRINSENLSTRTKTLTRAKRSLSSEKHYTKKEETDKKDKFSPRKISNDFGLQKNNKSNFKDNKTTSKLDLNEEVKVDIENVNVVENEEPETMITKYTSIDDSSENNSRTEKTESNKVKLIKKKLSREDLKPEKTEKVFLEKEPAIQKKSLSENNSQSDENNKLKKKSRSKSSINLSVQEKKPSSSRNDSDKKNVKTQKSFDPTLLKINTSKTAETKLKDNIIQNTEEKIKKVSLSELSAAIIIQYIWRKYRYNKLSKSKTNIGVNKELNKTNEINGSELVKAATLIQSIWRGFYVRKYKKPESIFGSSVTKEDTAKEELRTIEHRKKSNTSALKIQSIWRGYLVRKNIKDVNEKFKNMDMVESNNNISDEDMRNAAIKIQKSVRGYMARKSLKTKNNLENINEENDNASAKLNDEQILAKMENLAKVPNHSPEILERLKSVEEPECIKKHVAPLTPQTLDKSKLQNIECDIPVKNSDAVKIGTDKSKQELNPDSNTITNTENSQKEQPKENKYDTSINKNIDNDLSNKTILEPKQTFNEKHLSESNDLSPTHALKINAEKNVSTNTLIDNSEKNITKKSNHFEEPSKLKPNENKLNTIDQAETSSVQSVISDDELSRPMSLESTSSESDIVTVIHNPNYKTKEFENKETPIKNVGVKETNNSYDPSKLHEEISKSLKREEIKYEAKNITSPSKENELIGKGGDENKSQETAAVQKNEEIPINKQEESSELQIQKLTDNLNPKISSSNFSDPERSSHNNLDNLNTQEKKEEIKQNTIKINDTKVESKIVDTINIIEESTKHKEITKEKLKNSEDSKVESSNVKEESKKDLLPNNNLSKTEENLNIGKGGSQKSSLKNEDKAKAMDVDNTITENVSNKQEILTPEINNQIVQEENKEIIKTKEERTAAENITMSEDAKLKDVGIVTGTGTQKSADIKEKLPKRIQSSSLDKNNANVDCLTNNIISPIKEENRVNAVKSKIKETQDKEEEKEKKKPLSPKEKKSADLKELEGKEKQKPLGPKETKSADLKKLEGTEKKTSHKETKSAKNSPKEIKSNINTEINNDKNNEFKKLTENSKEIQSKINTGINKEKKNEVKKLEENLKEIKSDIKTDTNKEKNAKINKLEEKNFNSSNFLINEKKFYYNGSETKTNQEETIKDNTAKESNECNINKSKNETPKNVESKEIVKNDNEIKQETKNTTINHAAQDKESVDKKNVEKDEANFNDKKFEANSKIKDGNEIKDTKNRVDVNERVKREKTRDLQLEEITRAAIKVQQFYRAYKARKMLEASNEKPISGDRVLYDIKEERHKEEKIRKTSAQKANMQKFVDSTMQTSFDKEEEQDKVSVEEAGVQTSFEKVVDPSGMDIVNSITLPLSTPINHDTVNVDGNGEDHSSAGAAGLTSGWPTTTSSVVKSCREGSKAHASIKDVSSQHATAYPGRSTACTQHFSMESEKRNNSSSAPLQKNNMEVQAATKIQAGFRGYQVRKQLKLKTNSTSNRESMQNQKKAIRRKSSGRVSGATRIKIQNNEPTKLEEKSAVKIQAGVRGFLVRRRQQKQKSS